VGGNGIMSVCKEPNLVSLVEVAVFLLIPEFRRHSDKTCAMALASCVLTVAYKNAMTS
jgi:hypothetical protein